jgi:hypothetical protein
MPLDSDAEIGEALQPVTILVKWDDIDEGEKEARYPGFLTGDQHAMYVEDETSYDRLLFVKVIPTDDPDVYLETSCCWCTLGVLGESHDAKTVKNEIEFEDLIVPGLLQELDAHKKSPL